MAANGAPEASTEAVAQPAADPASADCGLLVDRIRSGDPRGMEELYRLFAQGVRFYLCRQLGPQDLDDRVHDTFVIVVQAIRRGELREPERLLGFVRTVVRRQVSSHIEEVVLARRDCPASEPGVALRDLGMNPEASAIEQQNDTIVERILGGISRRDREILTRFYLLEQTQEQICQEMDLSVNQFRLLKSRAKARFSELGRRRLNRRKFF
jgi:RNA polymerase sigma-70 factor, ECF subfamily